MWDVMRETTPAETVHRLSGNRHVPYSSQVSYDHVLSTCSLNTMAQNSTVRFPNCTIYLFGFPEPPEVYNGPPTVADSVRPFGAPEPPPAATADPPDPNFVPTRLNFFTRMFNHRYGPPGCIIPLPVSLLPNNKKTNIMMMKHFPWGATRTGELLEVNWKTANRRKVVYQ